jgi:spore germination protein GerM
VSRQMSANNDLPRAALQALLAGPKAGTGLKSLIPEGVAIRSIDVEGEVARIDLSKAFLSYDQHPITAEASIVQTMTSLPGVSSVVLSVEGNRLTDASGSRMPLLYYASANGLVAKPVSAGDPGAALTAYLAGPGHAELSGFPGDVRLLRYEYDRADRLLSLGFTYTSSIRELAMERPERMRTVLLGLIASLTEFPEVRAVQLDFEGQARLGLGQCSDLLRTPQARPQLLNDERLLGR